MRLAADAVDGDAGGEPLGDLGGHAVGDLGVAAIIEVVVVDVQFGSWVGLLGCLEGDADKVFAEDTAEDRVAKRTILVEDLVDNILAIVRHVKSRQDSRW